MTRAKPKREFGDRGSRERVVRPYALTAGRTRPTGSRIDVVALVCATSRAQDAGPSLFIDANPELGHEHLRLLGLCRRPASVADLAATLDLPLGVLRILISDLREHGLVSIAQPAAAGLRDVRVLKEVADALRRL